MSDKIARCRSGAERLCDETLEKLAKRGVHGEVTLTLVVKDGVISAKVTTTEAIRWDVA